MAESSDKLLVVCGPTATGKTEFALSLAREYNGELISADSRQVYRGMDIGTGKDIPKQSVFTVHNPKLSLKNQDYSYGYYDIQGIPLWLVDLAAPDQEFSVAHFYELAVKTINDVHQRKKLPILVGGTGLYIHALLQPIDTLSIPPNPILRQELAGYSVEQLRQHLYAVNPQRLEHMNTSDSHNPRRLIRAIEITSDPKGRLNVPINSFAKDTFCVGLTAATDVLYKRIDKRVDARIEQGILSEINTLIANGYGWDLPAMQTLGYREWKQFFLKEKTQDECVIQWKFDEHAYARRQMTWFRKQKQIHWYDITQADYRENAAEMIQKWYTKK